MSKVFTIKGIKYIYVKPYYLQAENDFKLRKAFVIGSSLYWKIDGGLVSYNKLKNKL